MNDIIEVNDSDKVSLETPQYELEQKLMTETDPEQLKNIVNIFNVNMQKKGILRLGRVSELQDKIVDQMSERLTKKAGEFSNTDLLNYFKIAQDTLNNSEKEMDTTPAIQINNNQLNVNIEDKSGLSRDSKEKVADAIKSILAKINTQDDIQKQDNFIECDVEEPIIKDENLGDENLDESND